MREFDEETGDGEDVGEEGGAKAGDEYEDERLPDVRVPPILPNFLDSSSSAPSTAPNRGDPLPTCPGLSSTDEIHPSLLEPDSLGLSHPLFTIEQLGVDRRLLVNRKRQLKMYRVWMQGKFQRTEADGLPLATKPDKSPS